MAAIIEQGFVVKKQNYGDHDLIVTILTINGKRTLIARGVRRLVSKNRVALQLGNLIEIEFFRARLVTKMSKLKRAKIVSQFPLEVADSAKVMLGILAMINKIETPAAYFFTSLVIVFPYFNIDYNHHIKTYFKFLYLTHHGVQPVMNRCFMCQSQRQIIDFDFEQGGFICQKHASKETSLAKLKAFYDLGRGFLVYKNVSSTMNFVVNSDLDAYTQKLGF